MNNTQRKSMIITTVQTMHNRMIYLKSQNRQKDAYALWKEWERRLDKDGKEISILTIT
jgi:hypothetical protein